MTDPFDPFQPHRDSEGVMEGEQEGQPFTMVLGYDDLRAVMTDWQTYTSDAPMRVPIPSEEEQRSYRQLPLEVDPPEHAPYRRAVSEPFSWATAHQIAPAIDGIVSELLGRGLEAGRIEIVRNFALPVQSRSLALMLGRSQEEAAEWISWGTHIFKELDEFGNNHAAAVDAYINNLIDDAMANPGDDFFGRLAGTTVDGRPMNREEMMGYAGIVFAGGRDTVIHAITNGIHFLSTHDADRHRLRDDPELVPTAVEEFLRFYSPVTHLGRVVRAGAHLHGRDLAEDSVVSLCFASANRDSRIFERADECLIDRAPNRHVAFGHGVHRCLGAPLAKTVVSAAIRGFVDRVGSVEVVEAPPKMEDFGTVQRQVSYERLLLDIGPRQTGGGNGE